MLSKTKYLQRNCEISNNLWLYPQERNVRAQREYKTTLRYYRPMKFSASITVAGKHEICSHWSNCALWWHKTTTIDGVRSLPVMAITKYTPYALYTLETRVFRNDKTIGHFDKMSALCWLKYGDHHLRHCFLLWHVMYIHWLNQSWEITWFFVNYGRQTVAETLHWKFTYFYS